MEGELGSQQRNADLYHELLGRRLPLRVHQFWQHQQIDQAVIEQGKLIFISYSSWTHYPKGGLEGSTTP